MLLLTAKHLSTVLEEEAPEKSTGIDYDQHEAYEYFHSMYFKVILYILRLIDKSISDSVKGIISLKGMMNKLKELFSQTNMHKYHELVGLIYNTQMTVGTPVIDHVMKL
ncbi:uncharacterized protein LOC122066686 [Macadamia integrifolia]|uniref:uncharacterized protein LOC122066686 n=1 Tax=Macadamia integrifolia TaxID=60698 RepID=UPI001C4FE0DE|nr:uncharacterized protein LOC122066686 [Macadamia integrifolia]